MKRKNTCNLGIKSYTNPNVLLSRCGEDWSIDIDTPDYSVYCRWMEQHKFSRGMTREQIEQWVTESHD